MSQRVEATPFSPTILFVSLGAVLFIALLLSILVFLPAWKTKDFEPTECKVVEIRKTIRNCDCGEDCVSRFPCLSVFVEFRDLVTGALRIEKAIDGYFSIGRNSEVSKLLLIFFYMLL